MKLKKIFCALLALCLIGSCMIACQTEPSNTEEKEGVTYTLGNIAKNIGDYVIVRSDAASEMVKKASVLVRTTAAEKTGTEPGITTDYDEAVAHEILVGMTNREESKTAAKGLKDDEYVIKMIGEKVCIAGANDYAVRNGVYEFLSTYFNYDAPEYNYHNVKDYGAEGDGKKDDTNAFKKAIAAAEKDGLPVYVPGGKYIVKECLTLNSVTLYGYNTGAWTADNCDLPILYHSNLEEPLFDVVSGSVSGLRIEVQGVNADTKKAAPTIRVYDTGGRVSNMTIRNPYIAVTTCYGDDFPSNPGRCFLENLFIVQAWNMGVYCYGTYDVATLCNIEVWNNNMEHSCPVAFKFGHNDDLRAVNLFTFNANVGFLYEEDPDVDAGGCWGSFANCSVDYTSIGVRVAAGTHHLTFTGGTYWTHHKGLEVNSATEQSMVAMSGCELKSNGASTVEINGGEQVTLAGCNIRRTMNGHSNPTVTITDARAVTLTGNTIICNGPNVQINGSFKGVATIVGNTIVSSTTNALQNAAKNAVVVIENNAVSKQDVAD